MVQQINGLAENVAAFKVSGEVTKADYDNVLLPVVQNISKTHDHLNFLLVLDTDLKNYTWGAWMDDAWLTLKNLMKFNRVALVSDSDVVRMVTTMGAKFIPGDYKVFSHNEEQSAINWVNTAQL